MPYKYVYKGGKYEFERLKPTKPVKDVSIIIPTYNEEKNIGKLIDAVHKNLNPLKLDYEIVIIDDNSRDKTPAIIDSYAKKSNVVALHRIGLKGVFSAIRDGAKVARGDVIVLLDADFSHPPEKIPELLKYIKDYDIVSGSRFIKGSKIIAPFSRKYATILLNKALRIILGLWPHDLTGVFHAIKKDKFELIQFKYPAVWGEFDMELFHEAIKKGFSIKEIPFTYDYRKEGESKSENLLKYGWLYLKRALQIRFFR